VVGHFCVLAIVLEDSGFINYFLEDGYLYILGGVIRKNIRKLCLFYDSKKIKEKGEKWR